MAMVAASARLGRTIPGLGRLEIGLPERPGAALAWSGVIDLALPGFVVEKHAIAAAAIAAGRFYQAFANPHFSHILGFHLAHTQPQRGSQGFDLSLVNPDKTWSPCAAVAATSAFKP